ncbi:MAG: methionine--tRNA ligase [Flavobacteriales bacterium]|nr:methionine--tRNA ligase [Flavobacteriales bacterium]
MNEPKRYTITSALPYANGPLHIGHIAGAYLPADIYARYLRQRGKDVLFICGSDEHGAAITLRAKKDGTTPKYIVDKYHNQIKQAFDDFGMSFDYYHRTSSELHHKTASDFFTVLNQKGELTVDSSEQYFDEEAQQFLADRYITGTCPNCGHADAYGDQCEKCGSALSPTELINPTSTLSGATPILKETSHWYLPMQNHEKWLKQWIGEGTLNGEQVHNPKEWKANVKGQCMSWIDGGLLPRAMTRDLDWGVKVPVEGADGKVLYVWLDAPIGYISGTKQWAAENNTDWEPYWKDKATKLLHFIGKDNIVFHCIIFPIILKAHGDYILPNNVPSNEFLNLEGDKISTSRNHAVWLHEYLEDFPDKQDELRYVLCSIAPETKDSEFTWKDYQARVNNELVAIFGNFVNRAVVLTHKYYDGIVPQAGELTDMEIAVQQEIETSIRNLDKNINAYRFRDALADAMNVARIGNKYLAETEPWKLIKTDEERVKTILFTALQIAEQLTRVFVPFLPNTVKKLSNILNTQDSELKAGHAINKAELLFAKIEDEQIEKQLEKLISKKKSATKQTGGNPKSVRMKDEVSFEDFTKMDIRTATILTAEKVEKADKLLKLTVDTGIDQRTVVSGIAEHYAPEEIIGTQVSILINLAPRKIRGVESQGMILMAKDNSGKLSFVSPTKETENGCLVS